MKSVFESLATFGACAALLAGCGGTPTPVNSAEVPAATEAKPSSGAGPASPATTAEPAKAPAPPAAHPVP